jgi:hypothetical protein
MIVHVVLFRPRADLAAPSRNALAAAVDRARREIPSIRRFAVGERTLRDARYAREMEEFPFVALIEFDDLAALQAYLQHPAHAELGRLFWMTSEKALAYDFDLTTDL